ncbi:hypothetical protein ElyMa_005063400 [Elysia marginata]|uniref:Uncharacterized protein n=1 Tax=Elysia marginata TaxID=1093978 RepID=A0AAV4JEL1_9GAST|nr:hypothetical protein ElyMa_005063400 [Elysia marginata]
MCREIIKKLKCLMSDRAAVMKCFDTKMALFKNNILKEDTSTHFLFCICNAHFLLGLSAPAEDAENHVEEHVKMDTGNLGRDASLKFASYSEATELSAKCIIRMAVEVVLVGPRGHERSGCRQEWLYFLSSINNKKNQFLTASEETDSTILFYNAFALLLHLDDL